MEEVRFNFRSGEVQTLFPNVDIISSNISTRWFLKNLSCKAVSDSKSEWPF